MARHRSTTGALSLLLAFLFVLFLVPTSANAQAQEYVGKFDAFTGFSYMASPNFNLYQRGFNGQIGYNWKRWMALGFDFSVFDGNSAIIPRELTPALQQALGAEIAGLGGLPPGYHLQVPFNAKTYTFAAGPQFNYRGMKYFTFFVHPDLGAIHENATLKPTDPIQTLVVQSLAPSGNKTDTVVFYGVGGGFDINATKHFALRTSVDYVHCFLFQNLLKDPRNNVRLSIGPTFRFGGNVK